MIPDHLINGIRLLPGLHTIIPVECVIERTMDAIFASAQRSVLKRKAQNGLLLLRWKPTAQIKIPYDFYGNFA